MKSFSKPSDRARRTTPSAITDLKTLRRKTSDEPMPARLMSAAFVVASMKVRGDPIYRRDVVHQLLAPRRLARNPQHCTVRCTIRKKYRSRWTFESEPSRHRVVMNGSRSKEMCESTIHSRYSGQGGPARALGPVVWKSRVSQQQR